MAVIEKSGFLKYKDPDGNTTLLYPITTKDHVDGLEELDDHLININNPHGVTKAQVGLGNVDNTSDTNKPISAATQTALDLKVDKVAGKSLSTNDYTTAEKDKLAGIESGANAYSLPTASGSTLGGVKTTSTVTSTDDLTACPIISGVPYYKDTNTTYSLGSFDVTATAAELNTLDGITATTTELNYVDGVTSNIQTQLDGKAESSHTHTIDNVTDLQDNLNSINAELDGSIKELSVSGKVITYTKNDGTTGSITTQDTNTTYSEATSSADGLMSSSDKSKLDGIANGANAYTLPEAGTSLGGVKTGGDVTISGGVITVNDDSHNHTIANVDGLQTALDSKANTTYVDTEIDNAVKSILGEDVSEAYDTLKEIQTLMEADDTASANLVAKVNRNEADITALETRATNIESKNTSQDTAINTVQADLDSHIDDATAHKDTTYTLTKSGSTIILTGSDGSSTSVADANTTYSEATQSSDGLMSASDKANLDEHLVSTNNPHGVTAEQIGAIPTPFTAEAGQTIRVKSVDGSGKPTEWEAVDVISNPITTEGTGSAYTATVAGITSLTAGVKFVIIPHTASTAAIPTLNVNGLGAKTIRQPLSTSTATAVAGMSDNWMAANKPVEVMYTGTWWVANIVRTDANSLYGTVPISKGGTGVTTEDELRELVLGGNTLLTESDVSTMIDEEIATVSEQISTVQATADGKAPAYTYGTTDLTAGSSELTTGTLYFVYE